MMLGWGTGKWPPTVKSHFTLSLINTRYYFLPCSSYYNGTFLQRQRSPKTMQHLNKKVRRGPPRSRRTCYLLQARKDLPLAAAGGRTSDVVQAIEFGAEVNLTLNGYTSLMRAANWGHVDTVAALIAEGADMFATDQRGRTALDWARIARRDKVVRTLERAMENEIRYRR